MLHALPRRRTVLVALMINIGVACMCILTGCTVIEVDFNAGKAKVTRVMTDSQVESASYKAGDTELKIGGYNSNAKLEALSDILDTLR